jgi:RNA polymerase sigma-70 factor (ECF subfamily)
LRELLAVDAGVVGDAGGKAPQWGHIVGAEKVARLLAAIAAPFARIGGVVQPHAVNGQPGAIFRDRDGKVLSTWALEIRDGRVLTIRAVINPDKLGHLGPVADPYAVIHEATRARRHLDGPEHPSAV